MKVLDIRSYETSDVGVCTIGGFIGELILSLSVMQKLIRAEKPDFTFSSESVEQFLQDILTEEFPQNIAVL